jgi:hypothetical protein
LPPPLRLNPPQQPPTTPLLTLTDRLTPSLGGSNGCFTSGIFDHFQIFAAKFVMLEGHIQIDVESSFVH